MDVRSSRLPAVLVVPVLTAAFGLSGCGFDSSKASGAIQDFFSKNKAQLHRTIKTVSCPSGVSEKKGGTFTCKLTTNDAGGGTSNWNVTVHMQGSGNVQVGESDFQRLG